MKTTLLPWPGVWRVCRCLSVAVLMLTTIEPPPFPSYSIGSGITFAKGPRDDVPPTARTRSSRHLKRLRRARKKPAPQAPSGFRVRSKIALVLDNRTSEELLAKDANRVVPIASITKLMTALVVLDAHAPLDEMLRISDADRDLVMGSSSRLQVGYTLSREDLLHLALMSSENRAASALSRYYPGGQPAFIAAMNAKASALGMTHTHFVNANGLTTENVSTAYDLARLVQAADQQPLIRRFTTDPHYDVRVGRKSLAYHNSDRLVGRPDWDIDVQKTGFTNAAGRCLVLLVNAQGRSLTMVFLDGDGKLTRFADASRVLKQLAQAEKRSSVAAAKAK